MDTINIDSDELRCQSKSTFIEEGRGGESLKSVQKRTVGGSGGGS